MSYGGTYYGALVFGAGLVVAALTPVPPAATDSNGYGTAPHGSHVYGAGVVVTSQVPVPPTPTAGDGNGRDADASDPGDFARGRNSSWHGTHVAGITGAKAAADGGVTGVAPEVTLGAYRVFGCAGSSSSDVINAALERAYLDELARRLRLDPGLKADLEARAAQA
jgi:hypothetical protein